MESGLLCHCSKINEFSTLIRSARLAHVMIGRGPGFGGATNPAVTHPDSHVPAPQYRKAAAFACRGCHSILEWPPSTRTKPPAAVDSPMSGRRDF